MTSVWPMETSDDRLILSQGPLSIAHLHDDVKRALHSGSCSPFPRNLRKMEAKQRCKDDCNQSNEKLSQIVLTGNNVPGAYSNGKKPEELKNEELKRWLKCRGASVSSTRMRLLQR